MLTGRSKPPSVLLVDGDPGSCNSFRNFFEQSGWSYKIASDSTEAANALDHDQFDVIIADVAMPNVGDYGLLNHLRENRPGQPIIAVGSKIEFEQALELFRSGADDLVLKPVDFHWLERSVQRVVHSLRQDERDKQLYKFVVNENTVYSMNSRECAEADIINLPVISRLLESKLLDSSAVIRLRLALQEAVVNALEHGNLELRSEWKEEVNERGEDKFAMLRKERLADDRYGLRRIAISSLFDGKELRITVKDDGSGFLNNSNSTGGFQPNMTERCSGRGLALMSSAVDELHFGCNGSEVTLIKRVISQGKANGA